jgi:uncharacterized protein (TIGR02231 family)
MWPAIGLAAQTVVSGSVTQVVLYRGQALVTREINLDEAVGAIECVVSDLPEHVVPESLYAEGGTGLEVRAVRFRARAVSDAPRQEVRQLDDQIEAINQKIAVNSKTQELLARQQAYLDQLDGFVAPTAKTELSHGVLNAEALERVTTFSFQQRQEILDKQVVNERESKSLADELALLQRRRAELSDTASQTVREAVVFLEKKNAGPGLMRLAYLVDNCGWMPSYTIRAGEDRKTVQLECNALIHQLSGEDWTGVKLTLSTASPALSAAAPGLAPFPIVLVPEGQQQAVQVDLGQQLSSIRARQRDAIVSFQNKLSLTENVVSNWHANAAANEYQNLELLNPESALRAIEMEAGSTGDGPSLAYDVAAPVSLASRTDQQMVRILQSLLPSRFHHVATPVLTSYVYREAELTNNSEQDMLGGPVTVYLNGSFVGRGEVPTVAQGQTFVVGFGADPQLRAKRELVDRNDVIQGGNRQLSFTYRLVVENFKTQPAKVSIFDRLPRPDHDADVEIKLGELKDALSDNKLYQRVESPKGILRWDIDVPASATGDNARLIEYSYTAEFDRQFQLGAATADVPSQQREFEQLQRARSKQ